MCLYIKRKEGNWKGVGIGSGYKNSHVFKYLPDEILNYVILCKCPLYYYITQMEHFHHTIITGNTHFCKSSDWWWCYKSLKSSQLHKIDWATASVSTYVLGI